MRDLRTSELLDIWDAGQRSSPMKRAWLLLRDACPDEVIEDWTLGRVNSCLLVLRQRWFGNDWPCLANCPGCGEVNEVQLRIGDLLGDGAAVGAMPMQADQRMQQDGWSVDYRLPCVNDLLSVGDSGGTANGLLNRLIAEVTHVGASATISELPEWAVQSIGQQVEIADPLASMELALSCAACSQTWNEPFHVIDLFWSELSALAERMLSEVGRLAQSFGWGEAEILAMSPQRRQRYLTWLGA